MISAIILAAGEGKRIGSTKALLNWGNVNLINYQINSLSHESITEKIVQERVLDESAILEAFVK